MKKSVIAIIDKRAPEEAKATLSRNFIVHEFISEGITYEAIKGHPDIFFFQAEDIFIIAPNTPLETIAFLKKYSISFKYGEKFIGKSLEDSTAYNCIRNNKSLFHKKGFTDVQVLKQLNSDEFITLPQAYTRCSMFPLSENLYLTSDKGIEHALTDKGFDVLYIDPSAVILPPYKNGFIGGCIGRFEDTLYFIGSLESVTGGDILRQKLSNSGISVCELYDGSLYDGGGIFFLETC